MSDTTTPGGVLTVAEVAEHFRVAERTVRRWVREERIATVRTPSGMLRFPRSVLEDPEADR